VTRCPPERAGTERRTLKEFTTAQGLERQAGDEHVLDEGRSRNQILELQVEDPLQALDAERSQLGQLAQQPAEVVRLALRLRVVGDVIAQAVNYFEL
jgi:hypothetical protein